MRKMRKILADFRQIVQELSTGEASHDVADRLAGLVDEFSALGLSPNVTNEAHGNLGNVTQVGHVGDPYAHIRQMITYLREPRTPEEIAFMVPHLSAEVDKLSQMSSGGSVSNSVSGNTGNVLQIGTIDGDINLRGW